MTPDDYQALGLYDPGATGAPARLELLDYLVGLGASAEDLVEYRDELPGLASVVGLRPGRERLTVAQLAERTGTPVDFLIRANRVSGLPFTTPDVRVWYDENLDTARLNQAASAIFGEETVFQLLRVVGSSMAKVADAIVSAFLVNVQVPAMDGAEPAEVELAVAKANAAAVSLLPAFLRAMEAMLRNHLLAARRSLTALEDARAGGYETQEMAVGFVDLVGSTALSLQLSARQLGAALSEFESVASDIVTDLGGRVVKFIGDEAMFVVRDSETALDIALAIAGAFRSHPVLPPVRAGVAYGELMSRDGDCFGPVVNLAARLVKAGSPGAVVVSADLHDRAGPSRRFTRLGTHELKGFDQGTELFELVP